MYKRICSIIAVLTVCNALSCSPRYYSLNEAARRNDVDGLRELLEEGHDVNAKDRFGQTPLSLCILPSCYDAAKFLLEHGANPDIRINHLGDTLLHIACISNDEKFITLIADHVPDINVINDRGTTPLQYYIFLTFVGGGDERTYKKPQFSIIKMFVAHGADVNAADKSGRTLMDNIRGDFGTHKDIVRYLVKQGARYKKSSQLSQKLFLEELWKDK